METTEIKQFVMPTHRDLVDAKRKKLTLLKSSPYAVFVKKISQKNKASVLDHSQIKEVKEAISVLAEEFDYEFLVDFQFAENMRLTSKDLVFMEEAQQVGKLKHLCMIESSPSQSASDLGNQIDAWNGRNPGKEIIVVSEVYTHDFLDKVKIAKQIGIKKYGIKFRSYLRHKPNLSKVLSAIKSEGLVSLVFGVFPKKDPTGRSGLFLLVLSIFGLLEKAIILLTKQKLPRYYLCWRNLLRFYRVKLNNFSS